MSVAITANKIGQKHMQVYNSASGLTTQMNIPVYETELVIDNSASADDISALGTGNTFWKYGLTDLEQALFYQNFRLINTWITSDSTIYAGENDYITQRVKVITQFLGGSNNPFMSYEVYNPSYEDDDSTNTFSVPNLDGTYTNQSYVYGGFLGFGGGDDIGESSNKLLMPYFIQDSGKIRLLILTLNYDSDNNTVSLNAASTSTETIDDTVTATVNGDTVTVNKATAVFGGTSEVSSGGSGSGSEGEYNPNIYPSYGTGTYTSYKSSELADNTGSYDTGISSGTDDETPVGEPAIIGGNGTFKPFGDSVGLEDVKLSSIDINDTGHTHIYKLTIAQVGELEGEIWNPDIFQSISQYFQGDVSNAILRLYKTRFLPIADTSRDVYLGSYKTEVNAMVAAQYKKGVFGTFTLPEYYGSFMDYDNTHLVMYLPYLGCVELEPAKYIGHGDSVTITVDYVIDFASGSMVYLMETESLSADGTRGAHTIVDMFPCNIATDIPFNTNAHGNLLQVTLDIINGATGGVTSMASTYANAAARNSYGITANTANRTGKLLMSETATNAALGSTAVGVATQAGTSALGIAKRAMTSGSGLGAGFGYLAPSIGFIVVYRDIQYTAASKTHYIGYSTRGTMQIGALHDFAVKNGQNCAFVQCDNVILGGGIPETFKAEIVQQLQSGVWT